MEWESHLILTQTIMLYKNKFLELHSKGHKILTLDECRDADLPEVQPNDCKVLCDYAIVVISGTEQGFYCIEVAKHKGRFYFGMNYGTNTGGGGSAPWIGKYHDGKDQPYCTNIAEGVANKLAKLIEKDCKSLEMYKADFISALKQLKATPKPIQLTLDLF